MTESDKQSSGINRTTLRRLATLLPQHKFKVIEPSVVPRVHLVLAPGYEYLRVWARQYGCAMTQLHLVRDFSDAAGYDDYDLVLFSYISKNIDRDVLRLLQERARRVVYTHIFYPVTQEGVIIDWREFGV